jgi:hypothetical protein
MSDTVVVALIAVVPTMLTLLMKFRQDRTEYRRSQSADNNANAKLDHITVLTNSTLTAANRRIGDLEGQVQELLKVIRKDNAVIEKPADETK